MGSSSPSSSSSSSSRAASSVVVVDVVDDDDGASRFPFVATIVGAVALSLPGSAASSTYDWAPFTQPRGGTNFNPSAAVSPASSPPAPASSPPAPASSPIQILCRFTSPRSGRVSETSTLTPRPQPLVPPATPPNTEMACGVVTAGESDHDTRWWRFTSRDGRPASVGIHTTPTSPPASLRHVSAYSPDKPSSSLLNTERP